MHPQHRIHVIALVFTLIKYHFIFVLNVPNRRILFTINCVPVSYEVHLRQAPYIGISVTVVSKHGFNDLVNILTNHLRQHPVDRLNVIGVLRSLKIDVFSFDLVQEYM